VDAYYDVYTDDDASMLHLARPESRPSIGLHMCAPQLHQIVTPPGHLSSEKGTAVEAGRHTLVSRVVHQSPCYECY
jgi:hypothetical protein